MRTSGPQFFPTHLPVRLIPLPFYTQTIPFELSFIHMKPQSHTSLLLMLIHLALSSPCLRAAAIILTIPHLTNRNPNASEPNAGATQTTIVVTQRLIYLLVRFRPGPPARTPSPVLQFNTLRSRHNHRRGRRRPYPSPYPVTTHSGSYRLTRTCCWKGSRLILLTIVALTALGSM